MQSSYASSFEREMGCTEAEWLGWLPAAIGAHPWQRLDHGATVAIHHSDGQRLLGHLQLNWAQAEPRRIALASIPRLLVRFEFDGLDAAQRYTFMRRFDLYMQRGGG